MGNAACTRKIDFARLNSDRTRYAGNWLPVEPLVVIPFAFACRVRTDHWQPVAMSRGPRRPGAATNNKYRGRERKRRVSLFLNF